MIPSIDIGRSQAAILVSVSMKKYGIAHDCNVSNAKQSNNRDITFFDSRRHEESKYSAKEWIRLG